MVRVAAGEGPSPCCKKGDVLAPLRPMHRLHSALCPMHRLHSTLRCRRHSHLLPPGMLPTIDEEEREREREGRRCSTVATPNAPTASDGLAPTGEKPGRSRLPGREREKATERPRATPNVEAESATMLDSSSAVYRWLTRPGPWAMIPTGIGAVPDGIRPASSDRKCHRHRGSDRRRKKEEEEREKEGVAASGDQHWADRRRPAKPREGSVAALGRWPSPLVRVTRGEGRMWGLGRV